MHLAPGDWESHGHGADPNYRNVIAPFARAEERLDAIPDWLPPEDVSEPVRLRDDGWTFEQSCGRARRDGIPMVCKETLDKGRKNGCHGHLTCVLLNGILEHA